MGLSHLVMQYDFNGFDLPMVGGWSSTTALIAGPVGEYL